VVIVTAKSLTSKSINSDTTNTDEVSLQWLLYVFESFLRCH
jgi:hypothetical protein